MKFISVILLLLLIIPSLVSAQDAPSLQETITLHGHENSIRKVAWSPDGSLIASTSADDTARLWDAETGETLLVVDAHQDQVHGIAFSPDGSQLITGGKDKTLRIWDIATGEEAKVLEFQQVPLHLEWSEVGIAVGFPRSVVLIDTEGVVLWSFDAVSVTRRFDWSPDRQMLVSTVLNDASGIYDAEGNETLSLTIDVDPFVPQGLDWANDADVIGMFSSTKGVAAWSAETGEVLFNAEDLTTVYSMAVSHDGSLLVYGDADKIVTFVDIASGETVLAVEMAGFVDALAWSPDGSQLAVGLSGSSTRHIVVYDVD